jgi:hypothetical protein
MRRERSAATVRFALLVALASLPYAAGEPALGTGAVARSTLPRCSPEGYGLEQATPQPADGQDAVKLTVGWVTGPERRRSCIVRTTIRLAIEGAGGVAVTADWSANAVLEPWRSVVHTWVWRNWCTDTQGQATVKLSVPSGRTVSQPIADPPTCVSADTGSTVTDLGTGMKYVKRPAQRVPPHILGKAAPPPVHWAVINPKNAWLVSDGYSLVAVYAGSPGEDPSLGRFAIIRQNFIFGIQYEPPDLVNVGRVGALKITRSPRGASHETSAQRGLLHFVSANGTKGVLALTGDRVRLVRR